MQSDSSFPVPRRHFFKQTTIAAAGLAVYGAVRAKAAESSPNETLRVAVMGLNRGMDHVNALIGIKNVEKRRLSPFDKI